ncbi:DUF4867 family protein [Clostridium akagii]|uniref:DUF4867 family protein n=1 Tax=Clostridium akagii TaxID=91623 RepID=UPI00047E8919|nr:DUF4867 family protein [Clostridium akagii]
MCIEDIRKLNGNLVIKTVEDIEFREYGKLLTGLDFSSLIKYAEETVKIPREGNEYVPSIKELEIFDVIGRIKDSVYGKLEIEAGSCTGNNTSLTGVEYHQGSEVDIGLTDCILIIGKVQDMVGKTYDSSKAKAFYLKKGQAIELYGTTLHYTPCKVEKNGFFTIVILLKGTNSPIENIKNSIITKKNKWFIAHPSQIEKVKNGAYPGLLGDMIEIKICS